MPLHRKIELAARENDLDKVRKLMAEADGMSLVREVEREQAQTSARDYLRRALNAAIALALYNYAVVSMYAYRTCSAEAEQVLAEQGRSGTVELLMTLRSWDTHARIRRSDAAAAEVDAQADDEDAAGAMEDAADAPAGEAAGAEWQVSVLPLLYVTDVFYGRSEWQLRCRKSAERTEWASHSRGWGSGTRSKTGHSSWDVRRGGGER